MGSLQSTFVMLFGALMMPVNNVGAELAGLIFIVIGSFGYITATVKENEQ